MYTGKSALKIRIFQETNFLRHRETSMSQIILIRAYYCYLFTLIAEKMEQKKEFAKSKEAGLD